MKYFAILQIDCRGQSPSKVILDADSYVEIINKIKNYDEDKIVQYDIYKSIKEE